MENHIKTLLSNFKYRIDYKKIAIDALREDLKSGDITSKLMIDGKSNSRAIIVAKENGILCGIEIAAFIFRHLDRDNKIEMKYVDGDRIKKGHTLMTIEAKTMAILTGERTALNFVQHLSGIATFTNRFVSMVSEKKIIILDTRKTTPGLRILEKYAVRTGGGSNHRLGLFDGILIKDNHIRAAGSVENALFMASTKKPRDLKVEIEVKNLEELKAALKHNPDMIMLDNFHPQEIKKAIKIISNQCMIEVSGNINEKNIRDYAISGVNFISIGAITHSARSLDISLELL